MEEQLPKKKCSKCRVVRQATDFGIRRLDIPYKTCVKCREKQTRYRERGGEALRQVERQGAKDWRETNKQRDLISKQKYIAENKCPHNKLITQCKRCTDPVKLSIKGWINRAKQNDKKKNLYDIDNFVNEPYLQLLVFEAGGKCMWCNCAIQYIEYNDTLAILKRRDTNLGHIISNCVITCKACNLNYEEMFPENERIDQFIASLKFPFSQTPVFVNEIQRIMTGLNIVNRH